MFDNVGSKVKLLAKIYCFASMVLSIITGLGLVFYGASENIAINVVIGFLCMIIGPLVSWVSSWLLYGFGQLVENSDILVDAVYKNVDDTYDANEEEFYEDNN